MQDIISELARYTVKEHINPNGKLKLDILYNHNKIGEYERNYSILYDTFYPFFLEGKYYALYSRNYTATRIMSLPDCKDLGGEEPHSNGFCPTGYYVPYLDEVCYKSYQQYLDDTEEDKVIGPMGQFGWVCGCVWGDDSSWKIQFLDLRGAAEGKIIRDERFGYRELLGGADKLSSAVNIEAFDKKELEKDNLIIEITSTKRYDLKGKQFVIHPFIECPNCNVINGLKSFTCHSCKKSYPINHLPQPQPELDG